MSIGRNIYFLRAQSGMTQRELAKFVGVSRACVAQWENDITHPKFSSIERLAKVFHVTNAEIMNGIEEDEDADLRYLKFIYEALNEDGKKSLLTQAEMHIANKRFTV